MESARLYTSAAGRLTFTVLGLDDRFVSSTSIEVRASRNANAPNVGAPSGQVADDLDDPGIVYPLNLSIPKAGDYKITIEYENGATIFRSNTGVTGFPFSIPGVMAIRGALFTQNNRVDTLTAAYYYFYDLKVKSFGCPSDRMAVVAQIASKSTPTISFTGTTDICEGTALNLTAPTNTGAYQWFFNNQAIANATSSNFAAMTTGSYTVSTSINNCLPAVSLPVAVTTRKAEKPIVTLNGIVLSSNATNSNQWLLNGLPITGATQSTFTALQTGNYAVKANVNGCGEVISDDVRVTITALENNLTLPATTGKVYPNPTQRFIVCEYSAFNESNPINAYLYDLTGRLIATQQMEKIEKKFRTQFNLELLQNGTFFVAIQEENTKARLVYKVVKQ
ncbi:MAG: T9SS type A sorting domain-containing protein [Spirosomataceae bacterium]